MRTEVSNIQMNRCINIPVAAREQRAPVPVDLVILPLPIKNRPVCVRESPLAFPLPEDPVTLVFLVALVYQGSFAVKQTILDLPIICVGGVHGDVVAGVG